MNQSTVYPTHDELLRFLLEHRFATTDQLARFVRHHYRHERSALRQASRHLNTLEGEGLVTSLERRVGGWQGGSTSTIWALTTTGRRSLVGGQRRERPNLISTTFLGHLLAVTETRLVLHELAHSDPTLDIHTKGEPECWRNYLTSHGAMATLRPDIALTVMSTQYTDHYFFEIDRATENPARVIRKCWQYQQYRRSGHEQERLGAYPAVVWLVPHKYRQQQLQRHLTAEPDLPTQLFTVITLDELPGLLRDGPSAA